MAVMTGTVGEGALGDALCGHRWGGAPGRGRGSERPGAPVAEPCRLSEPERCPSIRP